MKKFDRIASESKSLIPKNSLVRVTNMAGIYEVQYLEKRNGKSHILKTDKEHFIKVSDLEKLKFLEDKQEHYENMIKEGKIKYSDFLSLIKGIHEEISDLQENLYREFELKGESRSDNLSNVSRTFKNLRHLINTNFTGGGNEKFITLTYRENMRDVKKLHTDFKKFNMKFKYYLKKTFGIESVEYINVVEPQGRGAWHCHVLYKFPTIEKAPFIDNNSIIQEMWGHGFTRTEKLDNIDNIGAYLTAYMSNMPESEFNKCEELQGMAFEVEEREVESISTKEVSKRVIKGARLKLYPSGMNIYRASRGIVKPESETMRKSEFKEKMKKANPTQKVEPTFSKKIVVDNEAFQNVIIYEEYNLR